MKKLIAKLFGLEVPKKTVAANENLVVKVVADSDNLSDSLGIPEKRAKELKKLAMTSLQDNHRLSDAISNASKECTHANELFYVSWAISDAMHHMRQIGDLMSVLRGKGEDK